MKNLFNMPVIHIVTILALTIILACVLFLGANLYNLLKENVLCIFVAISLILLLRSFLQMFISKLR